MSLTHVMKCDAKLFHRFETGFFRTAPEFNLFPDIFGRTIVYQYLYYHGYTFNPVFTGCVGVKCVP